MKLYNKQQKVIKHLEDYIAKNLVRASTTKQAQSRRKQLEKMDIMEKLSTEREVHFNFPFTHSFNMQALEVRHLSIGYDKVILKDINMKLEFGKKYVITGANGVGKTTFLKTILGIIPAKAGIVKMTPYNDITYFSQEEKVDDITPMEYIRIKYPKMDNTSIRTLLGTYGVSGELPISSMKSLSGGENCKVRLARLSLEASNFLILDEPTNHLDKLAKKALMEAIKNYDGTVVMVSHEKEFYKKLEMIEIAFVSNV